MLETEVLCSVLLALDDQVQPVCFFFLFDFGDGN